MYGFWSKGKWCCTARGMYSSPFLSTIGGYTVHDSCDTILRLLSQPQSTVPFVGPGAVSKCISK